MVLISNIHKQSNQQILLIRNFFFILTVLLIVQCLRLQVFNYYHFNNLSQHNYLKTASVPASRGQITDRNGQVLVDNQLNYSIKLTNKNRELANQMLGIKSNQSLVPISHKQILQIKADEKLHDQFDVIFTKKRVYRFGKELFPVVGYGIYNGDVFNDSTGIEKTYNKILEGQPGYILHKVSAKGRQENTGKYISAIEGNTVKLTIDAKLQATAYKALGNTKGSVIVLDPNNGEILALVSKPSLDSNNVLELYQSKHTLNHKDSPEFNRVTSALISPGSTIKPFIALSALDHHIISPSDSIEDKGYLLVGNHKFHDWLAAGHGTVNLRKAIAVSCDTFFYVLAKKMGINLISDILNEFGFGHQTQVDLPNESTGLVPTPAWKKENRYSNWYTGDTIITTIGQGALLTTPIQLANATAILVNEGFFYDPHLLKTTIDHSGEHQPIHVKKFIRPIAHEHYELVKRAMQDVITKPYGTGNYSFGPRPYSIAGKTGTTQITSHHNIKPSGPLPKHLENHSLFIGFAPIKNPKVVIVTISENSQLNAATVSRKILDQYFRSLNADNEILY